MIRLTQALQSTDGQIKFGITIVGLVVLHTLWTHWQTRRHQKPLSVQEQAEIRKKRFERLQQRPKPKESNTKIQVKNEIVEPVSPAASAHHSETTGSAPEKTSASLAEESTQSSTPARKKKKTAPAKTPVETLLIVLRSLLLTKNPPIQSNSNHTNPSAAPLVARDFVDHVQATLPPAATWQELTQQYWPKLVASSHFDNVSLRQALAWLNRIRDVIQYATVSTTESKPHLETCLNNVLRQAITQRLAQRLAQEAQKQQFDEANSAADGGSSDDEFELGALFCDGYGDDTGTTTTTVAAESTTSRHMEMEDALTEFLRVLEPIDTIVSARVLQDLHELEPRLPHTLLHKSLDAIPRIDPCSAEVWHTMEDKILRSLTCLSNLVTLSSPAAKELHSLLAQQVDKDEDKAISATLQGKDMERASVLHKLLSIAALSVPNLGQESVAPPQQRPVQQPRQLSLFQRTIRQQIEHYPLGVFLKNEDKARPVVLDTRRLMQQARDKCTVILKRAMKAESKKDGRRQFFFRWLSMLLQTNESNVYVLASDLLREDAPQQVCASRKFLLGTATVVVQFCVDALWERYHKLGSTAFDPSFLIHPNVGLMVEGEQCLLPSTTSMDTFVPDQGRVFSSMTEFFFLSTALLRVSLFPGLRAEQELRQRHATLFDLLRRFGETYRNGQQIPPNLLNEQAKTAVDALIGWQATFEDPQLVRTVTKLSILQLKWIASIVTKSSPTNADSSSAAVLSVVPEWFCKLPAEWISFVATRAPKSLSVPDGEAAVECATTLLHLGTEFQGQGLSPPVITELIRIPGSFIRSGVSRARTLKAAKHARALRGQPLEEQRAAMQNFIVDERTCEVDIAFDKNGLGTTAFTNTFVRNRLSSTLLSTFSALDAVEGINVEREHAFDKFHVKGEVAELLLRLWSLRGGGAQKAVLDCPPEELSVFVCSIVSAIGLQVDDSCLKLLDIREILKKSGSQELIGPDVHHFDFLAKAVAGGFAGARKLLKLLVKVIEHDKVAAILGGYIGDGNEEALPVTRALTNLFLSLMERFTSDDGLENTELRFQFLGHDFDTNNFLILELGLDVGTIVHYLFALAARLQVSFGKVSGEATHGISRFALFVAENEDCSVLHLRRVLEGLVLAPKRRGGHPWKIKGTKQNHSRRWFVAQDQMTHASLQSVADLGEIKGFIDVVQAAQNSMNTTVDTVSSVRELQQVITACTANANDEEYSEWLSEWTFSSGSFEKSPGRMDHFYAELARKRNHVVSAKILQKEANKTRKLLPDPLASAAIFICFAEERMDVCKAIITGPESTPYSLGCFAFDLFFPSTYPSVPPLITFLTTGGGQVRFSPNLYNDGKVCISLLGTAHAWNAAQQWNTDSSLAQVLMSIQTQILGVNDPYFSEGFGHANTKNTPAGEEASSRFNNKIRLATVRHSMIDHLRSPPCGFEEVTLRHFSLCRKRLVVQVRRWMVEARGTPIERKFERAYAALVKLLSSDRMKEFAGYHSSVLPPLDEDVECLRRLDPEFVLHRLSSDEDHKPSAISSATHGDDDETDNAQQLAATTDMDPNFARAVADMIATAGALNNPWVRTTESVSNHQSPPNLQPGDLHHDGRNDENADDADDEMYT